MDLTLGATPGIPALVYQDGSSAPKSFTTAEITTDQTGLGTLVSVPLVASVDIGGERFAANVLVLPSGLMYGRVLPFAAREFIDAADAGEVVGEDRLRRSLPRLNWLVVDAEDDGDRM